MTESEQRMKWLDKPKTEWKHFTKDLYHSLFSGDIKPEDYLEPESAKPVRDSMNRVMLFLVDSIRKEYVEVVEDKK